MRQFLVFLACVALFGYALPANADWEFATIDSEGSVGAYPSFAFDSQGHKHVAYQDTGYDDLKYAFGMVTTGILKSWTVPVKWAST